MTELCDLCASVANPFSTPPPGIVLWTKRKARNNLAIVKGNRLLSAPRYRCYRVIDSIPFDKQALQGDPEFLEKLGPGLFVTIDAEQRPSLLVKPGTTVRIYRPDGTIIVRVVGGVEVFLSKVGLYFPDTEQREIPKSSQIELPA
jgi:hypothetical protein